MFTRDVISGQDYSAIPKTICINIIQFTLFPEEDYICTVYPTIQESGKILTDKWEIIYFQTKKLPENASDDLSEWLEFFTIKTEKELLSMQARTQSTGIRKAISIVENMNNNDLYKSLAEQREEALFNERLAMGAAFRKGVDEGMQRGVQQANLTTARMLFGMKMSPEDIAKATSLPLETILSIKP
jgi:predicted transposase/invertase (TIGR01784 family)